MHIYAQKLALEEERDRSYRSLELSRAWKFYVYSNFIDQIMVLISTKTYRRLLKHFLSALYMCPFVRNAREKAGQTQHRSILVRSLAHSLAAMHPFLGLGLTSTSY